MKKIFLAILVVVLCFGVVALIRLTPDKIIEDSFDNKYEGDDDLFDNFLDDSDNMVSDLVVSDGNVVSLSAFSEHDVQSDCWVAYDGKVYDITSWLPKHPGSASAILPYCGTYEEFTKVFTKQHGTSKVSMLMKMGTLMGDFEIQGEI